MPRYHFNLTDDDRYDDVEGQELPSIDAAEVTAVKLSEELMHNMGARLFDIDAIHVEVTDDAGLIVLNVTINAERAPAVFPFHRV